MRNIASLFGLAAITFVSSRALNSLQQAKLGLIESAILPLAKFVYREAEDDRHRDEQLKEVLERLEDLSDGTSSAT